MSDVTYKEAVSIAELPITDPIHKPCPDMEGLKDFDPEKTERARFLISKLREKHGIKKRVKPTPKPLNYNCTARGCIEPWGTVSKGKT
ncbi:hypothetical protein [Vibrio crassostreae]|jgi:hypothetical protein|uniref:hypothetical protein n=1 Tax=Vibrio crassostreae TaxID=246167 RepID=UPI000639230E|nr:hypothetical protein [Vibrio crassostreae]TCO02178.1 hypothetical protein EDB30_107240 [Vibrio crassostreae]CAK2740227.1 conserved hypothetical protein [Vibrio crassostreae]CAK3179357.1 conserved hypothetical protein [Vibrio crassostreae]CAK3807962.1 conserved hypothetical protein [Vibrio crassostreae]CDT68320.1 conserved hypothetical protein [Vibrio crassostreae]